MSRFTFKQFTVSQEHCAMKIGTDSILLGCLCNVNDTNHALDIGSGSGILALMLAQRGNAFVDAVEVDEAAAQEARQNFERSKWNKRLTMYNDCIQQFALNTTKAYDLIISNPPYYRASGHSKIEDVQRSKARHDQDLSFGELISCVVKLLSEKGSFWLILPKQEGLRFKELAVENKLHLTFRINVAPKPGKPANRCILQFTKTGRSFSEQDFVVYDADGSPSKAYKLIAQDFYTGKQFSLSDE